MAGGEVSSVGEAGDRQAPHFELRPRGGEPREVLLDRRVRDARAAPVQFVGIGLEVREPHIDERQKRIDDRRRREERRVEARVEPGVLEGAQQRGRPFGEEKRLAAGNRDSAAGIVVKRLVLQRLCDDVRDGPLPAVNLEGAAGTRRFVHGALGAVPAEVPETCDLPLRRLRFGVVAPKAPERTSLDVKSRADAGAVVDGQALHVKQKRRLHGHHSCAFNTTKYPHEGKSV